MRYLKTVAVSRIVTILAGSLPRRKMNGSLWECCKAAYIGLDRPQRAGVII